MNRKRACLMTFWMNEAGTRRRRRSSIAIRRDSKKRVSLQRYVQQTNSNSSVRLTDWRTSSQNSFLSRQLNLSTSLHFQAHRVAAFLFVLRFTSSNTSNPRSCWHPLIHPLHHLLPLVHLIFTRNQTQMRFVYGRSALVLTTFRPGTMRHSPKNSPIFQRDGYGSASFA